MSCSCNNQNRDALPKKFAIHKIPSPPEPPKEFTKIKSTSKYKCIGCKVITLA